MKKQLLYLCVIVLTIIDIFFLAYITFYPVSDSFRYQVVGFDLILCVIFWIEFILALKNSDNRKEYLKNNYLAILGMIPLNSVFLRALRFVKLAQLIKIFVLIHDDNKNLANFLHRTYLDKIILIAIIFIVILIILIWALDPAIGDLRTAVWYIFVSLTNTGYGDVVPSSTSGRIIAVIAMVGGILIFSLITAGVSSAYVSRLNRENQNTLESKIEVLSLKIDELNQKIDELQDDK